MVAWNDLPIHALRGNSELLEDPIDALRYVGSYDGLDSSIFNVNKEANMASVNVDDLWEVYPELKPWGEDYSNPNKVVWSAKVAEAAKFSRDRAAYDALREEFEDESIAEAVNHIVAAGGTISYSTKEDVNE